MPPPATTVRAFERSNFFYGLLLDADRLRKDHAFFNDKRALLNRLTVGTGVFCGLGVRTVTGPPRQWFIDPGGAIDPAGHEIVVGEAFAFDATQPTDDRGRATGSPLTTGTVEVCLAYNEVQADPVPVLVPDCDGDGECAPSTIREAFVVVVRAAADAAQSAPCTLPGFPVPVAAGLQAHIANALLTKPLQPPADLLVPIARIDLATNTIDAGNGRPLVYSNQMLFELIVCLAQHIAGTATRVLRYVSGDGQSGPAGADLGAPLVVELTDAAGGPITGETIQFAVVSGGGGVASATATTAANGRASTTWKTGPAGAQEVTATAKDAAFSVTFRATSV